MELLKLFKFRLVCMFWKKNHSGFGYFIFKSFWGVTFVDANCGLQKIRETPNDILIYECDTSI